MNELDAWVAEAAAALGLDASAVDRQRLLELARDAAHRVARPAAPLTTFLAGLAAGRAGGGSADVTAALGTLNSLLAERPSTDGGQNETRSAPA